MFADIPRPGIWKRMLLGGFLIVFAAAGATSVAAFHEVDKIVNKLNLGPELRLKGDTLATTDPGKPQTLMILGSDRRPKNNVEGAAAAGARTRSCSCGSTPTRRPRPSCRCRATSRSRSPATAPTRSTPPMSSAARS